MVTAYNRESLANKVISIFHERVQDEPCSYGEAILVLGFAFQQYHEAKEAQDESYKLAPFVSLDNLDSLHDRHLPNHDPIEAPGVDKTEVRNTCVTLYSRLQRVLERPGTTVLQKYFAVDRALSSFNSGLASDSKGSSKNPYKLLITGTDNFTGS